MQRPAARERFTLTASFQERLSHIWATYRFRSGITRADENTNPPLWRVVVVKSSPFPVHPNKPDPQLH